MLVNVPSATGPCGTLRIGPDPGNARGMTDPEAVQLATIDWTRDPRQMVAREGQVRPRAHMAPGRRHEDQGVRHRRDAARGISRQGQVEPGEPVRGDGRERAHTVVVTCGVPDGDRGRDLS